SARRTGTASGRGAPGVGCARVTVAASSQRRPCGPERRRRGGEWAGGNPSSLGRTASAGTQRPAQGWAGGADKVWGVARTRAGPAGHGGPRASLLPGRDLRDEAARLG